MNGGFVLLSISRAVQNLQRGGEGGKISGFMVVPKFHASAIVREEKRWAN